MHEDENPVLQEVKKSMVIVPYTKGDRMINIAILVLVIGNFVTLVLELVWGVF